MGLYWPCFAAAIVIGSGIGGLACAAALAETGHKALVLEQHQLPGVSLRHSVAAVLAGMSGCTTWAI
jgi:2-polyprenyl-6-methoxyphenol hydroxylase-like FAD-dependent oxidoreductase